MAVAHTVLCSLMVYSGLVIVGWWPFRRFESVLDSLKTDVFQPEPQSVHPEALMTTSEIIANRGYPVEIHHVITEDGYILQMHRIPFSKESPSRGNKKPVFLQHGLTGTDIVWILNPNNKSLAFILADRGYDVWLGNYRGNTYSRRHVRLDPEEQHFWEYSWDEMGKFDIPANVNYILNVTEQEKVSLIGHSMATALFSIAVLENPQLQEKIDGFICLGPSVSNPGIQSLFVRLISPISDYIETIVRKFGAHSFIQSDGYVMNSLRYICKSSATGAAFCRYILFDIFGPSPNFNEDLMHIMFHHYPSGGSLKDIKHWLQTYQYGDTFNHYDFGPMVNLERYGTIRPPAYDLGLIKAPVYLFWGDKDPLATPQDVAQLAKRLGNSSISIRIEDFTHGDFLWSSQVDELLYNPIVDILKSFS